MQLLSSTDIRRTRKPHRCFGCARLIPAGQPIRRSATKSDCGSIDTTHWCPTCDRYGRRHMEHDDEIMLGELRDNDREGWEAVRLEVEGMEATP